MVSPCDEVQLLHAVDRDEDEALVGPERVGGEPAGIYIAVGLPCDGREVDTDVGILWKCVIASALHRHILGCGLAGLTHHPPHDALQFGPSTISINLGIDSESWLPCHVD